MSIRSGDDSVYEGCPHWMSCSIGSKLVSSAVGTNMLLNHRRTSSFSDYLSMTVIQSEVHIRCELTEATLIKVRIADRCMRLIAIKLRLSRP